jgi:hypothetical protein
LVSGIYDSNESKKEKNNETEKGEKKNEESVSALLFCALTQIIAISFDHSRKKRNMVTREKLQKYAVHLLAECFATCILILLGDASVANYKFTRQPSHSTLPIAISFGIGVYSGNIDRNKQAEKSE